MKKSIGIYVKAGTDLTKYGFKKAQDGHWTWRTPALNGGLCVDSNTLRLTPYLGFCTRTIAVVIAMAEDKVLEVDEGTVYGGRPVIMRLSYDEACLIHRMRGHPEPSDASAEITPTDVKNGNNAE